MDKGIKQVVVLLAHPDIKSSQANKALMDAVKEMEEVAIYNLYEMRPEDAYNIDLWSKIISQASALVFQFPLYWMSAPSLLKKWQDEVFTYLAKTPAVAGKALLVAVTTGSEYSAYRSGGRNNFTMDELLRPYQASALHADQGLNRIPDTVSDEQALFVGDILATGFWATRISEITEKDTVLIIGAGPTGICTLLCSMLKNPKHIIVCEKSPERVRFIREHYPDVLITTPDNCKEFVLKNSDHGGADVVLEVAGSEDSFQMAWECARPNATVTIVALYDKPLLFPLPDMYGKNLIFKTGGVDGCDCAEILQLIEEGKIDTTPLITHRFALNEIEEAYRVFENKLDGVIKIAIY